MTYKSPNRKRTTTFPDGSKLIEAAHGIQLVEARARYRTRPVAKVIKRESLRNKAAAKSKTRKPKLRSR